MLVSLIALFAVAAPLRVLADPPQGHGGGGNKGNGRGFGGPQGPQGIPPPRSARDSGPQGMDDPLSDSVRRIERSTRGQVLSADRIQSDGRDVNRIKVVDDRGRVRVYMDEPRNGDGDGARRAPQPPPQGGR